MFVLSLWALCLSLCACGSLRQLAGSGQRDGSGGDPPPGLGVCDPPATAGDPTTDLSGGDPTTDLSGGDPTTDLSGGGVTPPSLAELQTYLNTELARLGKSGAQVVGADGVRPSADARRASLQVSAAPAGSDNAVFDLSAVPVDSNGDPLTSEDISGGAVVSGIKLSWTERLIGDYDQNGEVNLADLTPLAQYWEKLVDYDTPALHGGFARWPEGSPEDAPSGSPAANNWRLARVDGDGNGEINLADVTPIAVHWQERCDGYLIERGVNRGNGSIEWDAAPLDLGAGSYPSISRLAESDPAQPYRYATIVALAEPQFEQQFRVRAYESSTDDSGELSNTATYQPVSPSGDDISPPVWTGAVGISKARAANEKVTVSFGEAEDAQSPPVSYRLYWAPGNEALPTEPFDYASAQSADVTASPYAVSGLTNEQFYRFAVRALDSAATPNIEKNTVRLGANPTMADVYPPEWNGNPGVQEVHFGDGRAMVVWGTASDLNVEEPLQWQSEPVSYRLYYGQGQQPDLAASQHVDYVDHDLPPENSTTSDGGNCMSRGLGRKVNEGQEVFG